MARVVYPEAKYFKEIIDALGKLIDEVAFQLTQEGLVIKALDPARVALIHIDLPMTAFIEYDVSEETIAGISTANLAKMLKRVKKGDRFVLSVEEDRVEVVIESIG
ncbi:MAG: DNA polymerase sliding clamp, partial [Thermoprotei archaeon]